MLCSLALRVGMFFTAAVSTRKNIRQLLPMPEMILTITTKDGSLCHARTSRISNERKVTRFFECSFGTRFANSCSCQHTSFSMCLDKNHGFKDMCANDFTNTPLDHGTSCRKGTQIRRTISVCLTMVKHTTVVQFISPRTTSYLHISSCL